MKIRPIETEYNGYKFRSRLEARWAVFFDQLGIDYEYELEGFQLNDKLRYRPDFFLPKMDKGVYVEIKASIDSLTINDIKKMLTFIKSGNSLLLITGIPGQQEMFLVNLFTFSLEELIEEYLDNLLSAFKECLYNFETEVSLCRSPFDLFNGNWTLGFPELRPGYDDSEYIRALAYARRARFEFGDKE